MTAVDHAELKRCPFCGGPGSMEFSEFELHSGFHVVCHGDKDCPLYCSDPYRAHDTREEAAKVWSLRTQDAALLSEIEGLKAERDRLKLAICGGEDVPGSINAVSVDDCERFIREERSRHDWSAEQQAELDALRTQAPDSWRPDREAVKSALSELRRVPAPLTDDGDVTSWSSSDDVAASIHAAQTHLERALAIRNEGGE